MNWNDIYVVHKAVKNDNLAKLKMLVEENQNTLSCRDHYGHTPLLTSICDNRSHNLILYLIEAGSDINAVDDLENNSLHYLADIDRFKPKIAVELLKRGIDINAQNSQGSTPILESVLYGVDILMMLLYYNADVTIESDFGDTALSMALSLSNFDAVEMLIDYYSHEDLSTIITNYFYLEKDQTTLQAILQLESSKLFKILWPLIDTEHLLQTLPTLLIFYIDECKFPKHEWIEALLLILENNLASSFIRAMNKRLGGHNFRSLFFFLYNKNVDLEDRIMLINTFLSLGAKVSHYDIRDILNIFGYGKDFECLVYGAGCKKLDVVYHPLCYYLVSLQSDYSYNCLRQLFTGQMRSLLRTSTSLLQKSVITNLGYFSLPSYVKNSLLDECKGVLFDREKIKERLSTVPEFPTLFELSRNQVRNHIVGYYKGVREMEKI